MERRAWYFYGANLLLFAAAFSVWQFESVPIVAWLCGCLVWAVATLPLAIWYRSRRHSLPMFELVCLAYGFAYGVALFTTPNWITIASHRVDLDWDLIQNATVLAAAGIATGILGFFVAMHCARYLGLGALTLDVPVSARRAYIVAGICLGLAAKVVNLFHPSSDTAYGAILAAAESQFYIGLFILAYDTFAHGQSKLPLIAVTGVATSIGLLGGVMETAMLPLVLVVIASWQARRRFPFVLAALAAVFFFAINPVKYQYRQLTWWGEENVSAVDRVMNWIDAAQTTYLNFKDPLAADNEEDTPIGGTMQRIDLLHKFAYVQSMTPQAVPFLGGLSYDYLLYTFVPRVVWPDKPKASDSIDLVDYAYGFRFIEQNNPSSIGAGFIAEAYANFSWWGILMVMAIQGVIFGLLNRLLNGNYIGGQAIYATVMMMFLNGIGSSAVVLFGNIVQFTIVSILFQRAFCGSAAYITRNVHFGSTMQSSRTVRALGSAK